MASIGTKSYDAVVAQKVAFLGLASWACPWPAIWRAPATTSPSITARPPRRRPGPPNRRRHAATPREAPGAQIVFACVGNDDDLRSVVLGPDGAFAGMAPGAVFVDHTTASADVARELYVQAKELGLNFIDAPVSGGQAGAVNGALTIMCGGEQAVFDAIKPVAQAFGRAVTRVGAPAPASLPRWSTRSASQASCRASRKPWLSARRPTST